MREPAKTEHAARQRYTRIIQDSLSCITKAQWYVGPAPAGGENLALLSNPRAVRLRRSDQRPDLLLEASQLFTIVPDTRFPGEYKASTLAYIYSLRFAEPQADNDPEILAWHWHPPTTPGRTAPHIHVGAERPGLGDTLSKLHVQAGVSHLNRSSASWLRTWVYGPNVQTTGNASSKSPRIVLGRFGRGRRGGVLGPLLIPLVGRRFLVAARRRACACFFRLLHRRRFRVAVLVWLPSLLTVHVCVVPAAARGAGT